MEPSIAYARTSDDVSIAWSSAGRPDAAAPTLVHLPGLPFGDFAAEWRIPSLQKTYAPLARSVRLIQLDGRGSGHSQRDVTDLSLEAMLRDVDAVVDAARLERFAILGFYNSVTHAIACAAEHRERVTHLSLFGGALRGWIPRLLCPR